MTKARKSSTRNKKNQKREQSKISKILSRCNALSTRVGERRVTATNKAKSILAIRLLFKDLSPGEIKSNFSAISENFLFKEFTWLSRIRKPSDTFKPFIKSQNLEQDIIWCSLIVHKHKTIISECINLEKLIQKNILEKNSADARLNLKNLESKTGYSIWVESMKSGIDLIDDDLAEIMMPNLSFNNDALKYIIKRACGYYQDEDIFLTTVKTDKRIYDRDREGALSKIVSYYALPFGSFETVDYGTIFTAVKYTSIYDIYKLLLRYIRHCSVTNDHKGVPTKALIDGLKLISSEIDSPVIINAATKNKISCFNDHKKDFEKIRIFDMYINGKYASAVKEVNSIKPELLDFDIFEIAVRANIRSNNLALSGYLMYISECMKGLILKNSRYAESYQKLSFLAYTFRSLDWFNQLHIFIEKESEFLTKSDSKYLECNSALYINSHSTEKISIFGNDYADFLSEKNISASVNIVCNIAKNEGLNKVNLNTVSLHLSLLKTKELMNLGRPREVLDNLYIIVGQKKDPVLTIEAKRLLMDCLLLLKKNSEALAIFVTESLGDLYSASIYDIEGILFECIKDFKRSASIDYPIALSIFSRLKSSKYDSELKYSLEVFLKNNNYKTPKDLLIKNEKFEKDRLFYFLKWGCTQENMSLFLGLPSPEDIEKCRISICDYLIRKGDTSDFITKELLEINKRKAEMLATQNIDKSRIYVDTSTFHGRDSEQYRILFERYLQYCKIDFAGAEDELWLNNLVTVLKSKDDIQNYDLASVLSKFHFPDIRLNKKNATFLSLAKLFREEFTYGNKGLNNHLSTRIRHGVLPTSLRKPFADEGLYITSEKSGLAARFQIAAAGDEFTEDYGVIAVKILQEFSEKIENHIKKINDFWLQIYTQDSKVSLLNNLEEKNIGQFNFSISAVESYFVQQSLPISPTYDDLVKVMINWLWGKTNHNLFKIKNLIKQESEVYLNKILEDLRLEISKKIHNQQLRSELSNAISRAKGKLPAQIDLIQSWFTKDDHFNHVDPIDLSTVVEIAGKSLSLNIDLLSLTECKVSSRSISYFVDIL